MGLFDRGVLCGCVVLVVGVLGGCTAGSLSESERQTMLSNTDAARADFLSQDPEIRQWFETSYGYAMFPSVGKGGIGVGGARGEGLVFERGVAIGNAVMTQATIGFQLGGQAYRQVIFFENKESLDTFTTGEFEFAAQASAVALTAGASADADFDAGMAVFTVEQGGLMYEASIGGQKFSFRRF